MPTSLMYATTCFICFDQYNRTFKNPEDFESFVGHDQETDESEESLRDDEEEEDEGDDDFDVAFVCHYQDRDDDWDASLLLCFLLILN